MNDSALLRATSSKVRENPFLTDSDRRDGQDVVGRTFIPGMALAGGQAVVGGGRWDLRQGPLPPAGEGADDDGRQPAVEGCGLAHGAWAAAAWAAWSAPSLRRGPHRVGQAVRQRRGWTTGVLDLYGKRARKRYKTFVATGWRGDPGGAGGRAEWVGGLRLHQRVGEHGRDSLDGRRPVLAGDHLPRLQADRRSRPAAGAVRVGKYRCIQRVPVNLHADQGLGPVPRVDELVDRSEFRGTHDPKPPREPRRQASDALTGAAGGGHSCGSTPQGERRRNPGRLRTAAQLDRTILKEPTKSGDAHIWLTWVPEFA